MSWLRRWGLRRDASDIEQAKAALEAAERAQPEIERIGAELRRLNRENHFSPMVQEAIRRRAKEA